GYRNSTPPMTHAMTPAGMGCGAGSSPAGGGGDGVRASSAATGRTSTATPANTSGRAPSSNENMLPAQSGPQIAPMAKYRFRRLMPRATFVLARATTMWTPATRRPSPTPVRSTPPSAAGQLGANPSEAHPAATNTMPSAASRRGSRWWSQAAMVAEAAMDPMKSTVMSSPARSSDTPKSSARTPSDGPKEVA